MNLALGFRKHLLPWLRFFSFVPVLCLDSDRLVPAGSNSVFLDHSNVLDEPLLLLHTLHGAFQVSVQKAHYVFVTVSVNSNHCGYPRSKRLRKIVCKCRIFNIFLFLINPKICLGEFFRKFTFYASAFLLSVS